MKNRKIAINFHHSKKNLHFAGMILFTVFFGYLCALTLLRPSYANSTAALYVGSAASGTTCTQANPCSLAAALSKVADGGTIYLLAGNYPSLILGTAGADRFKAFKQQVTITPAPGAAVVTQGWDLRLSHLTLKNIVSKGGSSYTRLGADNIIFENFQASGPAPSRYISIRSNNVTIRNSSFSNNVHDLVAMGEYTTTEQPNKNILIENSIFGPAAVANNGQPYDSSTMDHVDCLQLFGGTDGVTIRNNTFFGCSNAEIIVKGDVNSDNKNVLIENNFMQTCTAGSYACGYYVLYVRNGTKYSNTNVILRNNTIDGSVSVDRTMPGFSMVGNIITTFNGVPFGDCSGIGVEYNLITQSKCATNKSLPASNKIGTPRFVNPIARDYHLGAGDTAARNFNVINAAATDIDGQSRSSAPDAGADEYVASAQSTTPSSTESGPVTANNPANSLPEPPLAQDPFVGDDNSATVQPAQAPSTAPNASPKANSGSSSTSSPPASGATPAPVTATSDTDESTLGDANLWSFKALQNNIVAKLSNHKQSIIRAGLALSAAASVGLAILWVLHLRHHAQYKNYVMFDATNQSRLKPTSNKL